MWKNSERVQKYDRKFTKRECKKIFFKPFTALRFIGLASFIYSNFTYIKTPNYAAANVNSG
jgi:hypothetical protein